MSNYSKIPLFFTNICTFNFVFGIPPMARCFSGQIFGFGLKWKTYFRSFTGPRVHLCYSHSLNSHLSGSPEFVNKQPTQLILAAHNCPRVLVDVVGPHALGNIHIRRRNILMGEEWGFKFRCCKILECRG